MTEEIKPVEGLRAYRKVQGHLAQPRANEVRRVLDQLILRQSIYSTDDRGSAHEVQQYTACKLNERMRGFEQYADLENLVNPALVHALAEALQLISAVLQPVDVILICDVIPR